MRLLIATPWGERLGGAENILWDLLRHVDRSRVEPKVVLLSEGPFEQEVAALGIEVITLPTTRVRRGGRKRFREQFTASRMAEELELHLRELINRV